MFNAVGGSAGYNTATVTTASQGNDTIANFEVITGSSNNDSFIVNGAATSTSLLYLYGSGGNDTITMNVANNAVMADYNTAPGATGFTRGVMVDLVAGTATDAFGTDSLYGVRGVSGSSLNDTILGSAFDDRFRENGGSDSIDGRGGNDMLDYSGNGSSQSVSVNLATGSANDGRGGTDTIISMEFVRGGSGNDTIIGNTADNELRGGFGSDYMDGGSGFDIADYSNNSSAAAISVNLASGRANDGLGGTDTLASIEYIRAGGGHDTMVGGAANERFRGNAGNDSIDGGSGTEDILDLSPTNGAVSANLVTGRANDGLGGTDSFVNIDVLYSGTAADTLIGGSGNDIFDGGMNGDLIDGGAGADRVRYYLVSGNNLSVTGGVSVDLAAQRATDGWGGADTLIGIERVTATNFADTLLGNNVSNRFNGLGGSDSIDGGLGSDWLEMSNTIATSGVTVNLSTGSATDGAGGVDSFTSIENAIGGSGNDHLTGVAQLNRAASQLRGGAGNDTLVGVEGEYVLADYQDQTAGLNVNLQSGSVNDGLGGVDLLVNISGAMMYGNFADTLTGTSGDDWLAPSGGNDSINGGDGYDIINYGGSPSAGVSVNLAAGRASDGDGGLDVFTGIEGVVTGYSNDTVIGDSVGNLVSLGAGADYADAGSGIDIISYSENASPSTQVYTTNEAGDQLPYSGVTIDLSAGRATDQGGSTDTILNFEDIIGSTMHDSILGSSGDNFIEGEEGNDTINGGAGNDWIWGGQGDNSLLGGAGDDRYLITPLDGENSISDSAGDDTIWLNGVSGEDISATDLLTNVRGIEAIALNGGGNTLHLTRDVVIGLSDNDVLRVTGSGNDVLLFDDSGWIQGTNSGGLVTYTNGAATVMASEGIAPSLVSGPTDGDETLSGGNDADVIDLLGGNDSYLGLDGNDSISSGGGNDTLSGGNGLDSLSGGSNDDSLLGEGGNDSLDAGDGRDTVLGGNGDDTIGGSGGDDSILGDAGNDFINGHDGNDIFLSGDGNDTLFGFTGSDSISAGNGDDRIWGDAGNDTIDAGDGTNDAVFYTQTGALPINAVVSASGGSAGINTATVFSASDDVDSVRGFENLWGSGSNDVITVNSAANQNYNLYLFGYTGNDTIIDNSGGVFASYSVVSSSLTSGISVNLATGVATDGFGGTDSLVGVTAINATSFNDTIIGGAGNDRFRALQGNDLMNGGNGSDAVDYNYTNQPVSVDLVSGRANDGSNGTDTLISIEQVRGGSGNDTIIGDGWDNVIRGNAGNDSLVGGAGTGDVVDYSFPGTAASVNLAVGVANDGANGTDTIIGFERVWGSAGADTVIGSNGDDILRGNAGNDSIDGGAGSADVADFRNATIGISVNLAAGIAQDGQGGTDTLIGIEQVWGSTLNDSMLGGAGNEFFVGSSGADTFVGGDGIDTVSYAFNPSNSTAATAGVSVDLTAGTGRDGYGSAEVLQGIEVINGSNLADTLIGGSGNNQTLSGGADDDSLLAGSGNTQRLYGDEGNDTLAAALGGNDTLYGGTGNDSLQAGSGPNGQGLLGEAGNDTLVGAGSEWLAISGGDDADSVRGGHGGNQYVYGDAGADTLAAGSGSSQYVYGGNDADSILGGSGNNQSIYGDAGNDTLLAGSGTNHDYLGGDGHDSLSAGDTGGKDLFGGNGNDTLVAGGGASQVVDGGAGDDSLLGSAAADTLNGGQDDIGNDSLRGGDGNDVLYGWQGSNLAIGGNGDDSLYASQSGNSTFQGDNGNDLLSGGDGADVAEGGNGNDVIYGYGGNDTLGGNDSLSAGAGADTFYAGSGNDSVSGGLDGDLLYGDDGNDTLLGEGGNDTLSGSTGANRLEGGTGNDFYHVANQLESVIENLSAGTDTIMTSVDITLPVNVEMLAIATGVTGITVTGGAGGDTLIGNGLSNTYIGGAGDDVIMVGTNLTLADLYALFPT